MAASETSAAPVCPECEGAVATEGTERVCAECGLVVDADEIDRGPDWRVFDAADEDEESRVGAPMTQTMHDKGLSTRIGYDDTDANGQPISTRKRRQLVRLRREDNRGRFESTRDRIRGRAFGEINRMAAALEVDRDYREQACQLFKQAHEADLLGGRGYEAVAAACVYAVARIHRAPVRLEDVGDVARVGRKRVRRAYGMLDAELGIPAPPPTARTHVPRLCDDLDADVDARRRAEELVGVLEGSDVSPEGCAPTGIAAGCVYRALREERGAAAPSQVDVATAAEVSDLTLRKRHHELRAVLEGDRDG